MHHIYGINIAVKHNITQIKGRYVMRKTHIKTLIIAMSLSLFGCKEYLQDHSINKSSTITDVVQADIVEGVQYTVLSKPLVAFPKNHVLEYFWYGCPHCYTADPVIAKWSKENSIPVEKRHSMLSDNWAGDARVFYTLKEMGLTETVGSEYFSLRQNFMNSQEASIKKALEKHNKSFSDYDARSRDGSVEMAITINKLVEGTTGAQGTPSFIVSGKYLINMEKMHSWKEVTSVAEYLIRKK